MTNSNYILNRNDKFFSSCNLFLRFFRRENYMWVIISIVPQIFNTSYVFPQLGFHQASPNKKFSKFIYHTLMFLEILNSDRKSVV